MYLSVNFTFINLYFIQEMETKSKFIMKNKIWTFIFGAKLLLGVEHQNEGFPTDFLHMACCVFNNLFFNKRLNEIV